MRMRFSAALSLLLPLLACGVGDEPTELTDSEWDALSVDDTRPAVAEDDSPADDSGMADDDVDATDDPSQVDEVDAEAEPAAAADASDDPIGAGPLTPQAFTHAGHYKNAVLENCADPGLIKTADTYYATCTGGGFPIYESTDLVHWKSRGRIFDAKTKPAWVSKNWWAPEIHHIGSGYILYYAGYSPKHGQMCIGAARAKTIEDGFTDIGRPLVCNSKVGLIDPHVLSSGGRHILYYKTEGNALRPQKKTIIYGHDLGGDGLHPGKGHRLLKNTLGWEGDVVEAPWVIERGSYFYMFYSGYRYCNGTYGVGVARARSPLGPFKKKGGPILKSNAAWYGPGHNSVVSIGGASFIVYHAWKGKHECGQAGDRSLLIDRISWVGGWPKINNGTPSRGTHSAP